MKVSEAKRVAKAIDAIAMETGSDAEDIILALTGICFSEEEAGEVRDYGRGDMEE